MAMFVQSNLDYPDLNYPDYSIIRTFFSGSVFHENSSHLENTKLKIDRLNSFKRLLKQRIIFVLKCDEKFLKQTNMLEHFRVYEYLHKK